MSDFVLNNFIDTDITPIEGVDYIIKDKSLIVSLTSSWLKQITECSALNKGLSTLNLTFASNLTALIIDEPQITSFSNTTGASLKAVSAVNLPLESLTFSATGLETLVIRNNPRLLNLNLSNVKGLQNLQLVNNTSLSGLQLTIENTTFDGTSNSFFFILSGSRLNLPTIDSTILSILSGLTGEEYGGSFTISNTPTGSLVAEEGYNELLRKGITVEVKQPALFTPPYTFHIVYNNTSDTISPSDIIGQRFFRIENTGFIREYDYHYSENEKYLYRWQGRTFWGLSMVSGGNFGSWAFDGAGGPSQFIEGVGVAGTNTAKGATTLGNIYLTAFNYMISAYSTNSQVNNKLFYNGGRTPGNSKSIYYSQDKQFILSANGPTQWFMFPTSNQNSSYSWNAAGAFPSGTSLTAIGEWFGTSTTLQWLCS